MEIFLLLYSAAITGFLSAAIFALLKKRAQRKQKNLLGYWPIPTVSIEELYNDFSIGPLGPGVGTAVQAISNYRVTGGISDFETWIICNLAKKCDRIFEFGTCTGKTTYLLALNSPNSRVTTLTLHPDQISAYGKNEGDDARATNSACAESSFSSFLYNGTLVESRIEQLFMDSKSFDDQPYASSFQLIFVDGSHAESYVESDTRKALSMLAPGGICIWHDYRGPRRARGVFAVLNKLAKEIPLRHVKDTSFVIYQKPKIN